MCVLCSLCVCVFGLKTPAIAWSKIHISQWCACRQNSIDQDCPKCHSRATMCHYLMNYHLVLVRNTLIGLASGSKYKFVRPSFSLLSLLNYRLVFILLVQTIYLVFEQKNGICICEEELRPKYSFSWVWFVQLHEARIEGHFFWRWRTKRWKIKLKINKV